MAKFKVHIEATINVGYTVEADSYRQALKSIEQKGTTIERLKVLTNEDIQSISEKTYIVEISKSGGVAQD